MIKGLKNNINTIILVLFYTVGIQIVTRSILLSRVSELENTSVQNIDMFLFIINLLIVIFAVLLIFFQSCLYKIILIFFQFEKNISFMRNFAHVLKGTTPFIAVSLIYELFSENGSLFELLNQPIINSLNVLATNTIYVLFLKKDLEISAFKTFMLGSLLVILNLLFTTVGSMFI